MNNIIYTIGHSNHSSEIFVKLLTEAQIDVLVDVRSNPGSPWASYANSHELKQILKTVGIQYIYMGDVLGGRPDDPAYYNQQTGKANYDKILDKVTFKQGLGRLLV